MPLNHTSIYAELTEDHFIAIGKLVIEWSNIEFLLGVLLSRLLITPEYLGRTYTDELNALKIKNAINNAVEIHKYRYQCKIISDNELIEVSEINVRADKLRTLRNKFAHFCWTRVSDEEIFGTSFSGKIPKSKKNAKDFIKLKLSELVDAYNEAYEIVDKLTELIRRLPQLEENQNLIKLLSRTR